MDETFCRIALLTGLVVFTLLAVVLPVIRHRIRHGSGTGFVLAQVTDPVGKVVGVAITTNTNLVGLFGFVFFFFGAAPVQVWTWVPSAVSYLGVACMVASTAVIVTAQAQMGKHWRMCIDNVPTGLVTSGLFGFVRNPIYLGTILFNTGVALLAPSPWTLCFLWMGGTLVALQARLEEKHLLALHGDAYRAYAASVGRFFPGLGTLNADGTEA